MIWDHHPSTPSTLLQAVLLDMASQLPLAQLRALDSSLDRSIHLGGNVMECVARRENVSENQKNLSEHEVFLSMLQASNAPFSSLPPVLFHGVRTVCWLCPLESLELGISVDLSDQCRERA